MLGGPFSVVTQEFKMEKEKDPLSEAIKDAKEGDDKKLKEIDKKLKKKEKKKDKEEEE